MGARYDQVEPHVGIVRVPLEADLVFDANGEFGPVGVSINANGRLIVGSAGTSGIIGVLVKNIAQLPAGMFGTVTPVQGWMGGLAGDIMDVMIQGEILDVPGLTAGIAVYVTAAGALTAVKLGNFYVGFTVEADRLFVNVNAQPVASA